MKKFVALLLVLVMCTALALPALAAEDKAEPVGSGSLSDTAPVLYDEENQLEESAPALYDEENQIEETASMLYDDAQSGLGTGAIIAIIVVAVAAVAAVVFFLLRKKK